MCPPRARLPRIRRVSLSVPGSVLVSRDVPVWFPISLSTIPSRGRQGGSSPVWDPRSRGSTPWRVPAAILSVRSGPVLPLPCSPVDPRRSDVAPGGDRTRGGSQLIRVRSTGIGVRVSPGVVVSGPSVGRSPSGLLGPVCQSGSLWEVPSGMNAGVPVGKGYGNRSWSRGTFLR